MSNQVWIFIAVVVIVAIIVAYQRSRQSQVQQTRDLRMGAQEQGQAQSPSEEISQREERRLTGMSTEDRDWEQASLQRNRDIQEQRRTEGPDAPLSCPHMRPGAILRGTRNSAGRELCAPRCVPPRWHARGNRCSTDGQLPGR